MRRADFARLLIRATKCSSIAKWPPIVIFARIGVLSAPVRAGTDTVHPTAPHQQTGSAQFVITTVSARNDLISGDSALVRIGVSSLIPVAQVGVYLYNVKITSVFKEMTAGSHVLQGLVTSLRRGDNTLLVRDEGNQSNATQLVLTDHSITGPILSGPHITPYECRTTQNALGGSLDADCSATRKITYYYRSTSKTFKSLTRPTGPYPTDLAIRRRSTDGLCPTSCGSRPGRSIAVSTESPFWTIRRNPRLARGSPGPGGTAS
jgi:Tannase-like family of unknown function (DUF6351)